MKIPFQRPELPPAGSVEAYFAKARSTRWFSNFGPCHEQLSERLSVRLGGVSCLPVASGTAGLLTALLTLCSGQPASRRYVIMPSFTFVATANAALLCGLEPIFVDVDPSCWHLDPAQLERALADHAGTVAAILPVSAFGAPPPAQVRARWRAAAASAEVPLIVDSAAGFGAVQDDGSPLGSSGDVEVFSFHATKPFAIGEGGLVVTDDHAAAETMVRRVNFAFDERKRITSPFGFNGKLSELHSAVALAVLDRFDDVVAVRRERARTMRSVLEPEGFSFQQGCEHSPWQCVPVLAADPSTREAVVKKCTATGVEVRRYYHPLHMATAFRSVQQAGALEVTEDVASRAISLPMANDLSEEEADLIITSVCGRSAVATR